jgi:hypothetical protein
MRFYLIHVPDDAASDTAEVTVVVPGAARAAIMVPLDALPGFLPLLHEAAAGVGEPRCTACDAPLAAPPTSDARPQTASPGAPGRRGP